jgi:aspartate racemase
VRRLGLIGGVSPESTEIYVRLMNRMTRARLGGEHSANFIVWHLDYGHVTAFYRAGDFDRYGEELALAAKGLERAGADAVMIGSNTSHIGAETARRAISIPLVHIVDALAAALRSNGATAPLFLGTEVSMSGPYYQKALRERYDGATIIPLKEDRAEVERIIFDELCLGVVSETSKRKLLGLIARCPQADGVILGCTELSLMLSQADCTLPVFDTTAIHAAAGVEFALGEAA